MATFSVEWGQVQRRATGFRRRSGETHTGISPYRSTPPTRAAGATQASYGLGWHITDYRGHSLHEHRGAVDGFRRACHARRSSRSKKRFGVVLLTNLEDMEIVNAAGNIMLDHLLGGEKGLERFLYETQKGSDGQDIPAEKGCQRKVAR